VNASLALSHNRTQPLLDAGRFWEKWGNPCGLSPEALKEQGLLMEKMIAGLDPDMRSTLVVPTGPMRVLGVRVLVFFLWSTVALTSSIQGKPGPDEPVRLFPIANTDVSVRVFPKSEPHSGSVWFDFVRTGSVPHEAVGKPANTRLFVVNAGGRLEETIALYKRMAFHDIPIQPSDETYMVFEGSRMRAFVDEERVTDFLIPLVEDLEADLAKMPVDVWKVQ